MNVRVAKASTTEEPGAGKPHGGVCAEGGKGSPYCEGVFKPDVQSINGLSVGFGKGGCERQKAWCFVRISGLRAEG